MIWSFTLCIVFFSSLTRTDAEERAVDYYDDEDKDYDFGSGFVDVGSFRRQGPGGGTTGAQSMNSMSMQGSGPGQGGSGAGRSTKRAELYRFSRTTPFRLSFAEDCDYLAYYCMKAYQTGRVCGRTYYYMYHDFANYCMLDYVNCMERQEVWQLTHMGACFAIEPLAVYKHYPYENDYFLDQYYLLEDKVK